MADSQMAAWVRRASFNWLRFKLPRHRVIHLTNLTLHKKLTPHQLHLDLRQPKENRSPWMNKNEASNLKKQSQFVPKMSPSWFIHFLYRAFLLGKNVQSSINRPSLSATMDRGSWGEAKGGSWSIRPFISRIPTQPPTPLHWPAPSQPAQAEMGGSHASNKSHLGHGNKPLRELLLKQALFHAVSYLVYHQFYQWDVMTWQWLYTHHIWFKYVSLCQEGEQKHQL